MPPPRPLDPPIPALFPERDALLAAVRGADPADDLPALVYADWQDEHGQPEHAELIRVMCELPKALKRTPEAKARKKKLLARMQELFKTPALKPLRKLESNTYQFQRGFAHDLTLTLVEPPYSLRHGWWIHPWQLPTLPNFVPFDKLAWLGVMLPEQPTAEHTAALAAVPWLTRVDRIETTRWGSGPIRPGTLAPILTGNALGGLRCFVPHSPIAASELLAICLAKSATRLMTFPLQQARRTTPDTSTKPSRKAFLSAVEQIVSAKRARQFTSFGEELVDVDEALAKILLASKHLGGIRTFSYDFAKITAKTRTAFVERFGTPVEE